MEKVTRVKGLFQRGQDPLEAKKKAAATREMNEATQELPADEIRRKAKEAEEGTAGEDAAEQEGPDAEE